MVETPRPNVVITGLTAAGKTTHSTRLASELRYEYVSGIRTLAQMCDIPVGPEPPRWRDLAAAIEALRDDEMDNRLEHELARLATERDGQVFDVWALAWTTDAPMVRVWLHSDPPSRERKCYVSHEGELERPSLADCRRIVSEKDNANRSLFLRTQGFDLFTDHSVFDVVFDNTRFIPEPTRQVSDLGIEGFAPIFNSVVSAHVHRSESAYSAARLALQACPEALVRSDLLLGPK